MARRRTPWRSGSYRTPRVYARRRRSGDAGVPLGVGVACYVERSGGPSDTDEFGSVEVEPDGSVIARSGSTCSGQGHPTAFPQVVATALDIGVPPAVVGAVCDALDVAHIDMPLTPETVWRAAHPAA